MDNTVVHGGSCHCKAVQFEVEAPEEVTVYDCNCSICQKKQNKHFVVPHSRFTLIKGKDSLTEYRFNTRKACHMFCKVCGVQCFYQPRSNPDGYGIMPHTIDTETLKNITIFKFDGQNWEKEIKKHEDGGDASILKWSEKPSTD